MPSIIRDYRDIVAWQKAQDFAVTIDIICDRLPRKHWYLAGQMRRAGNSVHANIAEGNGRFSTVDYLRHLSMSNGSLNEAESDLYFIRKRFVSFPDIEAALALAVDVRRPLWGLVKSLRAKKKGNREELERSPFPFPFPRSLVDELVPVPLPHSLNQSARDTST